MQVDLGTMLRWVQGYIMSQAETITRKLFLGGVDVDIKCLDEKLNLWCTSVKYLWIEFLVIIKETCMSQENFPVDQGGE